MDTQKRYTTALALTKRLPAPLIRTIVQNSNVSSPILYLKNIFMDMKRRQLVAEQVIYSNNHLEMTVSVRHPDRVSVSIVWENGVFLRFPNDYFEDHHYTPERIFSVLHLLYDRFRLQPRYPENLNPRDRQRIFLAQSDPALWDVRLELRRSVERDPLYRSVRALYRIIEPDAF